MPITGLILRKMHCYSDWNDRPWLEGMESSVIFRLSLCLRAYRGDAFDLCFAIYRKAGIALTPFAASVTRHFSNFSIQPSTRGMSASVPKQKRGAFHFNLAGPSRTLRFRRLNQ